nr:heavy metal translocating P-type ATPase [uncultured Leptotrichia sp.]
MAKETILSIVGLDCPNCAAKVERKIGEMPEIMGATVDFLGEKLFITTEEENKNSLIVKIQEVVDKVEEGVVVSERKSSRMNDSHIHEEYCCCSGACEVIENEGDAHSHGRSRSHSEEENIKKNVTKFVIGGIIFAGAILAPLPNFMKIVLYLVSYLIIGGEVVLTAIRNIKRGEVFDENFLMTVATVGAFAIKEYPEAVAVMLFYMVGELFQDVAVGNSRKSITALMDIRPDYANLKIGDEIKRVSPETVDIGELIVVKPGEKVPLDGEIVEGNSTFDTSALTGESLPKEVMVGESILSGFINKTGLITVKVTKSFSESTVSKILDLVQNASGKKSKTEDFITKFARYYTPAVVIVALILAIVPPVLLQQPFSNWIYRALTFLVVSCPCALVISVPLGFFGGIGGASKHGILVKGANYLEALTKIDTVVMDKTGTLTKGIFKVTEINMKNNQNTETTGENELLKYTAYAESFSNHPIAQSIVKEYEEMGNSIDKSKIEKFEELSGYGLKVRVDGKDILAGNAKLMYLEKITIENEEKLGTVVYVAIDGKYAGNIVIADEIKEDSESAILGMKKQGIKNIVMLTGDNKKIGESVAKKLGITKVFSELLPTQKVEKLEEVMIENGKNTGKVLFVGDGINDAPVLARADVGVAMGGVGSDAAIEAADIVIMNDEPSKIVTAIEIAKKTKIIVWQNIIFALAVKGIILIMGALGFATMWEAVFGDVGVALIAILNSMRTMYFFKK